MNGKSLLKFTIAAGVLLSTALSPLQADGNAGGCAAAQPMERVKKFFSDRTQLDTDAAALAGDIQNFNRTCTPSSTPITKSNACNGLVVLKNNRIAAFKQRVANLKTEAGVIKGHANTLKDGSCAATLEGSFSTGQDPEASIKLAYEAAGQACKSPANSTCTTY